MLVTPVFRTYKNDLYDIFIGNVNIRQELTKGIYLIESYSFERSILNKLEGWYIPISKTKKKGWLSSYGVCDEHSQIIKKHHKLLNQKKRKFVISLVKIEKKNQPSEGGWRWHKWGPYLGTKKPKHEYLYDEDDSIEFVYVYQIFEVLNSYSLSLR